MIPILVLWAVPRSTSTAFERMMKQRGDHEIAHEPFGEVWYSIGNDTARPTATSSTGRNSATSRSGRVWWPPPGGDRCS